MRNKKNCSKTRRNVDLRFLIGLNGISFFVFAFFAMISDIFNLSTEKFFGLAMIFSLILFAFLLFIINTSEVKND